MSGIEKLRNELARIHMTFKMGAVENVDDLVMEILEAEKSIGLEPWRRAEGYALTPSTKAAVAGLPHLRIAKIDDLLTVWIRAPYALDENRCRMVGLEAGDLYRRLLAGAKKIAEIFRKYSEKSEFLQISLP